MHNKRLYNGIIETTNGGGMVQMVQLVFHIQKGDIVGCCKPIQPIVTKSFAEKKCNYCGQPFKPYHSHNLYCSRECRSNSDKEHTEKRVREYRKRYTHNDRSILNVGTGELGEHALTDFEEEHRKIQNEFRHLRLRSSFH